MTPSLLDLPLHDALGLSCNPHTLHQHRAIAELKGISFSYSILPKFSSMPLTHDVRTSEIPIIKINALRALLLSKFSRTIPIFDAFMTRGASSMHVKNDHNINLKRRLKRIHAEFHGSFSSDRRRDLLRSYKYGKKGMLVRLSAQGGGSHESVLQVL
ncbi:hypothetical protein KSP39_PZI001527 [Platanthera zijinensis]|uniref:Uncharacterized protein n=1 Tax=Platanthera zijinensis TaxID=2320716 RepID=A0AAP0C5K4_9ASPA